MQTFLRDVRYSLRLLGRQPGFTLTAIAVLALGIGVNAGVFGLVNGLLLRPLPGESAGGRVVGLYSADRTLPDTYRAFSYPNFADIRDAAGPFTSLSAHNLALAGITEGDTTRRAFVDVVSSDYFETLGVRLQRGRVFTREEERPGSHPTSVIASHVYWERRVRPGHPRPRGSRERARLRDRRHCAESLRWDDRPGGA
jgi:MacB-like periplasmic core domain